MTDILTTENKQNRSEIWKDIKGYERLYQISNNGKVKSLPGTWCNSKRIKKERIMKPFFSRKYHIIELSNNGIQKLFYIHILVADHFIPNPDNLPEINHEDCNTLNNCDWNLKRCTRKYNMQHAVDNGLILSRPGSLSSTAKLTEADIPIIRARRRKGETYISIARDYGVDFTNIYHIIKGNSWKHVK